MNLLINQKTAIFHLSDWKVGALFMDAGTGKTRTAVEIVNRTDIDLVVWVGPLGTIRPPAGEDSVMDEVAKWGGFRSPVVYTGVESIQGSDRIYLDLLSQVERAKNPFVVIDESLKIKNAEAKRTRRLLEIGKHARYKLILNGTPITKNLQDLWSQMEFLSPKILNMSLAQYKNTFVDYTVITKRVGCNRVYTREFINGYENIDYLYSLIRHYVFECDLTLDVKQYYNVLGYIIGKEEKEEYQRLKEKYLDDDTLQWKNNNIFLEMTQKMQHAYCCTPDKFEQLDKLFKTIDESRTIIFCKYVSSREACESRYPKATVLSYQKSAFGLNLQRLHNTVYFDKNWDYGLRTHSSRRTWRTGQEYDCRYWDMTGNVGLDVLIDKNIENKVGMVEYFKSKTKQKIYEAL